MIMKNHETKSIEESWLVIMKNYDLDYEMIWTPQGNNLKMLESSLKNQKHKTSQFLLISKSLQEGLFMGYIKDYAGIIFQTREITN